MRPIRCLRSILILFATMLLVWTEGNAQTHDGQTIQDAIGMIQAQDFAGAASVLTAITEREPDNARAWNVLGVALRRAEDLDGALKAYFKAAEFESTGPRAMYNVGLIFAQMGRRDQAFAWLSKARETNRINMTQIGIDPVADSLRDDPRFGLLFPSAEEYADPFVEDVTVIQEWVGEATGDQFGWIARNIGDVDGDGIHDVTTSAPTNSEGGANAGKVYAFSSGSGDLLWTYVGAEGDQLGLGIEAAGDVNGDGIPDVIAGAPGGGKAYVWSGIDGRVLLTLQGEQSDEIFGRKVADIGDANGDGFGDVLVGAPGNDHVAANAGTAYVFSGKDGSTLLTLRGEKAGDRFGTSGSGWTRGGSVMVVVGAGGAGPNGSGRTYVYDGLTTEPSFVIESDETGGSLGGMFVSVVGDVNADGTPDVYASDWSNSAKGPSTGRIYVHDGATGARLLTLTGEASGDGFGIGTADAGDLDGDGHDDLVIGAWQHGSAAPSGGKTYVYSGKDGSLLHVYTGKVQGETFGFDTTGMGDVDGDGVIDFLLTSAWSAISGTRSGRMFIVSGKAPDTN